MIRGWGRLLVWAGAMALLGLLPLMIVWSDLPDPVATHWGPGGVPDGTTPKAWLWVLPIFVVAIGLLTSSFLRRGGRPSAEAFAIVGLLGGIGIWTSVSIVTLNSGAETWHDAAPFDWWQILGILVAGLAFGWLGYRIGKRWYPPTPFDADTPVLVRDLSADEQVTWTGSARVMWPFLILLPLGVVFLFSPDWLRWLAPLFLALSWLFSRVDVRVDSSGMRVRLAGLWTVKKVPLDRIVRARPIDLEPAKWGGWGYRMVAGGSAIVLRRGDAIEVLLHNDRRFAVTVDDAAAGAALLNGQVSRLVGD